MTGEEYKVWQPPERAAGTKKKKESLFFSFSKRLFKMFVSKIIQDLHDYQSQPEKRLSYDGKIFFPTTLKLFSNMAEQFNIWFQEVAQVLE